LSCSINQTRIMLFNIHNIYNHHTVSSIENCAFVLPIYRSIWMPLGL
jgi:hypothetical protein